MNSENKAVRTDMYCHDCGKNFVAVIDFSLDGNHEIHCPWCAHKHFRVVEKGIVTGERYSSDHETHTVGRRQVWKSACQPIMTSTASAFIRDLWLNRN